MPLGIPDVGCGFCCHMQCACLPFYRGMRLGPGGSLCRHYLGDRKQYMIEHGGVFVVMLGGIGTLDEWMSTLAVMTIGNNDPRPIIVANIDGLYDATLQQLADMTRTPFARSKNLACTLNTTSADDLLSTLNQVTSL